MKKTPQAVATFIELRAKRTTFKVIGETLGYTERTMFSWGKKYSAEVDAAEKALLKEKAATLELERLERIGIHQELLLKARNSMEKKNYDNVPTGELDRLIQSHLTNLRRESLPVDSRMNQQALFIQLLVKSGIATFENEVDSETSDPLDVPYEVIEGDKQEHDEG